MVRVGVLTTMERVDDDSIFPADGTEMWDCLVVFKAVEWEGDCGLGVGDALVCNGLSGCWCCDIFFPPIVGFLLSSSETKGLLLKGRA